MGAKPMPIAVMPTPNATQTAQILFANRRNLIALGNYSEQDTVRHLIDPTLEFLGFPAVHQRRELQSGDSRPDIVLYDVPAALAGQKPAAAILEAKPLNADLEGRGLAHSRRPKSQLMRYIIGHPSSGPGTYGFLTDGNIWHTIRRSEYDDNQANLVQEWRLLDGDQAQCAEYLAQIKRMLADAAPAQAAPARRRDPTQRARDICNAIAQNASPAAILQRLTGQAGPFQTQIQDGQIRMSDKARMEVNRWQEYAFDEAAQIRAEQADASQEALCAAVARVKDLNDVSLYREDVALAAETFAKAVPLKMSVALIVQPDESGKPAAARLAVHYQGHTGMTTEFNPHMPAPKTLRTIQRVYDQLNRKAAVRADTLVDAVAAKTVRKEFFEKLANGWTLRQQRKAAGSAAQRHNYREAVLRHLIRVIFVWILNEDGKLPPEAFDEAFAKREAPGTYHKAILTFLFHERLNQPPDDRITHANPRIQAALDDTRFLNGSLFARHQHDHLLDLADADYFGADANAPGLFAILNEYDWTSSEHTPYASEQTIDPEVLSNLFENLIAATRFGEETPDRMPAGTYYTPADVAFEMVKDALAEATLPYAPASYTRADLRLLFGSEHELPPTASDAERNRLIHRIQSLAIYDPAVGSGEFPFICHLAIKYALQKLHNLAGMPHDNASLTRDIIARQLYAQDINPMAVQVTRLRLFIAIIAAENAATAANPAAYEPLPNLEAKIVCADTTATVASPNWSPFGADTLQSRATQVNAALAQVANIRERWQTAHDEQTKAELRQQDDDARKALRAAIGRGYAGSETIAFANHPLLDPDAPPVETDPRLLFYRDKDANPDWRGFDIVIGNPPYESVNKDLKTDTARRDRREILSQRRYRTIAGGDLYNLIAEAALTLANPNGGVVTLIVPLSICFGQNKKDLRRLFEERSSRINLRCHDNRPDKVFHNSPVEHGESRVRATIITAVMGNETPIIETSGINRWAKSERHEYFTSRPRAITPSKNTVGDARIDAQWERIHTTEIAELIAAMSAEETKIANLSGIGQADNALGFPPSAMYFITITPAGHLKRREKLLPISGQENLELAVAAANTHAAYAWWMAYGDAFDINHHEIATIAVPRRWLADAATNRRVRRLARDLIAAVNPENIRPLTTGTLSSVQDSLNFHECAPAAIAELDALYLEALTQPPATLRQLHRLRSNVTWRLGADAGQSA